MVRTVSLAPGRSCMSSGAPDNTTVSAFNGHVAGCGGVPSITIPQGEHLYHHIFFTLQMCSQPLSA
jgi:hypothetical protein